MKLFSFKGKHLHDIRLDGFGTIASFDGKHDSAEFFYKYISFTNPGSTMRMNMTTYK